MIGGSGLDQDYNDLLLQQVTAVAQDDPTKGGNLRVVRNDYGIWVPPPNACAVSIPDRYDEPVVSPKPAI